MTEKERMLAGDLYLVGEDQELAKDNKRARMLTRLFNQTTGDQKGFRHQLLEELFESFGQNSYIEPPFRCDYGCHISIGDFFYANFDCIILDVNKVTIGDYVFFGPRVNIFAAGHPVDVEVRNTMLEYGKPVTIGSNVWVGGNSVINPGVRIGEGTIIGSGAVVTRDIPANVLAAGNPCRVIREIEDTDKAYWNNLRSQYVSAMCH